MSESRREGAGFFRGSKARTAEEAIGHSEGLVTVLRLTQADLKPAEAALMIAKQFFDAHHYSKALHAAQRAESIAVQLDERFNRYQQDVEKLQTRIVSMQRLGLRTDELEATLGRAEAQIVAGVWESGAFVPNYLEACGILERAEQDGRGLQENAERASNGIFMAELAIESLADLGGPADPVAFARGAASPLEQALQDATKELALGNASGAALIAKNIEAKAIRLKTRHEEATRYLDGLDAALADLRGEGALTLGLESQIKMARDMLDTGIIEPAAAMSVRLQKELTSLGEAYRKSTMGLADAEIVYSRLQREGFHSYEADAAIRDTRRSLGEGNYARAVEHLDRAHEAFARRTNARVALAKAIEEMRTRVRLLDGSGLALLPDVLEVLIRAEREFHKGNFSGSSEDLRMATVLLDELTRAPAPKK